MGYVKRRFAIGLLALMLFQTAAAQNATAAAEARAAQAGWREWVCGIACGLLAADCCLWVPAACQVCIGGGLGCASLCVDALTGESEDDCWDYEWEETTYPCEG